MITYPQPLLQAGGAKTGIAPVNLLDVLTVAGQTYYWADRKINVLSSISATPQAYLPWIDSVGDIKCYRSLQTATATFTMQNVSGDSLQRDFERIMRQATLEGAFFIYRMWQNDAQAAWFEMHGTLTVTDVTDTEVRLKGSSLLDASETDGLPWNYSETCQLEWASARCGSTQPTPCQNSFPSCQVVERFVGITNSFETNWGEATATVSSYAINRRRKI